MKRKASPRRDFSNIPSIRVPMNSAAERVPDVLLSGHHANIEKWRAEAALEKTRRARPELVRDKPEPKSEA